MSIPHIPEYQDPRILDLLGRIKALEAEMAENMKVEVTLDDESKALIREFIEAVKYAAPVQPQPGFGPSHTPWYQSPFQVRGSGSTGANPDDYPDPPYLVN